MKLFIILLMLMFVSCSSISTVRNEQIEASNEILLLEDQYTSRPSWESDKGYIDNNIVVVGSAEGPVEQSEMYLQDAADFNAKVMLTEEFPEDIRIAVQSAASSVNTDVYQEHFNFTRLLFIGNP